MAIDTDIVAKDSGSLAGLILDRSCISKTFPDENSVSAMSGYCLVGKYTDVVKEKPVSPIPAEKMSNPLP